MCHYGTGGIRCVFAFSSSQSELKLSETDWPKERQIQGDALCRRKKRNEAKQRDVPLATTKKSGKNEMDTTSKTILFIGDSMVECLFPRMSAYAKKNGHKLLCCDMV